MNSNIPIINKRLPDDVYLVPVTWEMCGFVAVKADSPEQAYEKVSKDEGDYALPADKTYVEASFAPSFEDSEMVQVYTDSYNKGELNILIDKFEE